METIPHLSENDIRPLATQQSWARGQEYYHNNCVDNIVWRDGLLTAEVEGSGFEAYIEGLMDKHQRKYKLMPMLREL